MAIKERPYTGLTASVKINNSIIGYMSGIDLTLEKSIIEVLQFGATYQEKVPAIKNWTATADGTVAFTAGGSQKKLYDAFESGELVTLGIFLSSTVYFEGDAYVSNLNITGAPDDKMSISCDFEGNGAVTFTLPQEYLLQIRSGVGGTTNPGGSIRVASGGTQAIVITPAAGYVLNKIMDNNVDKTAQATGAGAEKTYTLTSIAADHVIQITFSESA